MSPSNPSLGFIGLGVMGSRMALNLANKMPDSPFHIYDLSQESMQALQAKVSRTKFCQSSREVAEKSDIICTIVPEGIHVRSVFLTPETGVLAADLSGKLIFELSTIDTETSLDVGNKIRQKYPTASFYDAPVSGGDVGADAATLTIMVGCAENDANWAQIEKVLSTMGKDIIACGGPSHGLTAKICNNYCSSIITIATSDTFNMAIRAGMDPRLLQRIFKTSSCANNNCQVMNPVPGLSPKAPPSHGYKGGFKVQYMVKDVGLAMQMAKLNGANLAMGYASMGIYAGAARDPNCKDLDSKVVYRYLGGPEDWAKDFE